MLLDTLITLMFQRLCMYNGRGREGGRRRMSVRSLLCKIGRPYMLEPLDQGLSHITLAKVDSCLGQKNNNATSKCNKPMGNFRLEQKQQQQCDQQMQRTFGKHARDPGNFLLSQRNGPFRVKLRGKGCVRIPYGYKKSRWRLPVPYREVSSYSQNSAPSERMCKVVLCCLNRSVQPRRRSGGRSFAHLTLSGYLRQQGNLVICG